MNVSFSRRDDLLMEDYPKVGSPVENFLGRWHNTNPATGQIVELEITQVNDTFYLQAYGAGKSVGEKIDWGKVECEIFSSNIHSRIVEGLTANYDMEYMNTRIASNLKYGILVIQTYNTFRDGSERSNYFTREFFHQ